MGPDHVGDRRGRGRCSIRKLAAALTRAPFHLIAVRENGSGFQMRYRPSTLRAALWQRMAGEVAGMLHCARCPAPRCGRWFLKGEASRSDKQFCSAPRRNRAFRSGNQPLSADTTMFPRTVSYRQLPQLREHHHAFLDWPPPGSMAEQSAVPWQRQRRRRQELHTCAKNGIRPSDPIRSIPSSSRGRWLGILAFNIDAVTAQSKLQDATCNRIHHTPPMGTRTKLFGNRLTYRKTIVGRNLKLQGSALQKTRVRLPVWANFSLQIEVVPFDSATTNSAPLSAVHATW